MDVHLQEWHTISSVEGYLSTFACTFAALQRKIPVGVSFPASLLEKIDTFRGDVPRSTYIRKLIEANLPDKQRPERADSVLLEVTTN